MGAFAGPFLSINGELSIDIENPDTGPGESALGALLALSFSPLFHFGPRMLDIVVGPRLGFFADSRTYSSDYTGDDTYSGSGYLAGFQTGAFISLGRIYLGGLLSVTAHKYTESCDNDNCYDPSSDASALWIVGLNGAMMY